MYIHIYTYIYIYIYIHGNICIGVAVSIASCLYYSYQHYIDQYSSYRLYLSCADVIRHDPMLSYLIA